MPSSLPPLGAAFRDEGRMRAKYGKYWATYCEHVRYKIIPGLL